MAKEKIDYGRLYNLEASKLAEMTYAKRFRRSLETRVGDIKDTILYEEIKEQFGEKVSDDLLLDEVRVMSLHRQVLRGGTAGIKAIELTYRLDGTLNNIENEVDLEDVEKATEGIN